MTDFRDMFTLININKSQIYSKYEYDLFIYSNYQIKYGY